VIAGLALLSTIDDTTNLAIVGTFMAVLGLGLGATMQNTVLAVQNSVAAADLGSGSSVVAFFRSMGGSIGVSALGAALSHQVSDQVSTGLTALVKAGTASPTWTRCPRRCDRSSSTPSVRRPVTCS